MVNTLHQPTKPMHRSIPKLAALLPALLLLTPCGLRAQDTDGTKPDWIELFNPTNAAVDLTDWQLRDSGAVANWFTFPAGEPRKIIPSGGYLVVLCRNNGVPPGGPLLRTGFQLGANGETIRLMQPNPGQPDPFAMQDEFTTTPVPPGSDHSPLRRAPRRPGAFLRPRHVGLCPAGRFLPDLWLV